MKMFVLLVLFLGVGLFLVLVPNQTIADIFSVFTFENFGVRRIKRWKSNTDTLGNVFLSLCALFCCGYWLLPDFLIMYTVMLLISSAACLGVTAKLFADLDYEGRMEGKFALIGLYVVSFVGLLSACGFLNQHIFLTQVRVFREDWFHGSMQSILYFLTNPSVAYVILEGILLFIPFGILWNHFKYMRTEKTLRAENIYTFCLKMAMYSFLMILVGMYGFTFINEIYHFEYKFA